MNSTVSLCEAHSNLNESDIAVVNQLSNYLQFIADLTKADIFIDVITRNDEEALVVAEANPKTAKSLYTQSVVGELALKMNEPAVLKSLTEGVPVWEVKGVSQEGIPIKQSVIPLKNSSGRVVATLIMEQDISEQIQTEAKVELLSETTEKLTSALLDLTTVEEVLPTILQDAVIITNRDYTVLYANVPARQLLGTDQPAGQGKSLMNLISELIVDSPDSIFEEINVTNEINVGNRIFKFKHVPFKRQNQIAGHIMLFRDVTELRHKEKELMAKAAVIKEIHHRVKNNLQTVSSLLRMQMRRAKSEQVKKALLNSINRISSIALIHEVLSAEDIHYINLIPLIEKVANLSIQTIVDNSDLISVTISGISVQLPSEIATATAMVLNELIQNTIEHGFDGVFHGTIEIGIEKTEDRVTITVSDNGRGLPRNFSVSSCAGLGLTIVDSIVREKLRGDIVFGAERGTTVRFSFPLPEEGGFPCTA